MFKEKSIPANALIFFSLIFALILGFLTAILADAFGDSSMRLFGIPLMLLLTVLFILNKRLLLVLIIIFRASIDPVLNWAGVGLGGALNLLVIGIATIFLVNKPLSKHVRGQLLKMWVGFLTIGFVAVIYSPDISSSLRFYLSLLSYAMMFIIPFYLVRTTSDIQKCIQIILISTVIPIIYGFIELVTASSITVDGVRLHATFTHANVFAYYLVLMIAFSFFLIKNSTITIGIKLRKFLPVFIFLLLVLLVLTKTRGAWFACLELFIIYGFFFERKILIFIIAAGFFAMLIPAVHDRIMDVGQGNDYALYAKLNSYAWRKQLWISAIDWIKFKPFFGYGLNMVSHYSPTFFPLDSRHGFDAHNVYVQFAFDMGLLGLIAYFVVKVRLLLWIKQFFAFDKKGATILLALMFAYMISSYSDNIMHYSAFNWYYWFVMGFYCSSMQLFKLTKSE